MFRPTLKVKKIFCHSFKSLAENQQKTRRSIYKFIEEQYANIINTKNDNHTTFDNNFSLPKGSERALIIGCYRTRRSMATQGSSIGNIKPHQRVYVVWYYSGYVTHDTTWLLLANGKTVEQNVNAELSK